LQRTQSPFTILNVCVANFPHCSQIAKFEIQLLLGEDSTIDFVECGRQTNFH